ncbi:hypothetical protein BC829DRAFT_421520 [Chytridium lagenaria]|nr:hypothetical protein BC829DRAFT_421520 [Chytridium lagenaria]
MKASGTINASTALQSESNPVLQWRQELEQRLLCNGGFQLRGVYGKKKHLQGMSATRAHKQKHLDASAGIQRTESRHGDSGPEVVVNVTGETRGRETTGGGWGRRRGSS